MVTEKDTEKNKQDPRKLESSVLLVSEFSVNKLSLEINSRGKFKKIFLLIFLFTP